MDLSVLREVPISLSFKLPCFTLIQNCWSYRLHSYNIEIRTTKDCMKRVINEENNWHHNTERDALLGPVDCVRVDKVVEMLNGWKSGETVGN